MRIALGADHAGYELKEKVKTILKDWGHDVIDFGTHSKESVDYPDYAIKVAFAVIDGRAERGIAVCWTGNGVTIATNKIDGIRATLALNADMARLARSHNDSNVLTLSSRYIDESQLEEILQVWLETHFDGGRHIRRLAKIPGAGYEPRSEE